MIWRLLFIFLEDNSEDAGFSVYTHYGASQCSTEEYTSTVLSGYLASSSRNHTGAGYNYVCFPKVTDENPNEKLEGDTSAITGVTYGLLETRPIKIINEDDVVLRGVSCAVCLVKKRTDVFTFLGKVTFALVVLQPRTPTPSTLQWSR